MTKENLISFFKGESFVTQVTHRETNDIFSIMLGTAKELDKNTLDKVRKEGYQVRHIGTRKQGSKFNPERTLRIWFEPRD